VCCDANLAVRFVSDSSATEVHDLWSSWRQRGVTIVAPSLFRFEIPNAIHRIAVHSKFTDDLALSLLQAALQLPVQLQDIPRQHHRALALSRQYELRAAYDAHYLALSESLECEFFTSDAKLFNAIRPNFKRVTLVSSQV
jgi:predicted nucleic acid-binding protein